MQTLNDLRAARKSLADEVEVEIEKELPSIEKDLGYPRYDLDKYVRVAKATLIEEGCPHPTSLAIYELVRKLRREELKEYYDTHEPTDPADGSAVID